MSVATDVRLLFRGLLLARELFIMMRNLFQNRLIPESPELDVMKFCVLNGWPTAAATDVGVCICVCV